MRGRDQDSYSLSSYVDLEDRVPLDQPLRVIREIVNQTGFATGGLGSGHSHFANRRM